MAKYIVRYEMTIKDEMEVEADTMRAAMVEVKERAVELSKAMPNSSVRITSSSKIEPKPPAS